MPKYRPLSDRQSLAVIALIGICALVFATRFLPAALQLDGGRSGAVPAEISAAWNELAAGKWSRSTIGALGQLVAAIFLHGGPDHLLFNMIMLWPFGLLAARHLGPIVMIAVFLFCGICGNIVQVVLNLESTVPIVGASGAISGLQGLYLGLALRWDLPDPDVWPLAHPIPPMQLGVFAAAGFAFDAYSLMNHAQGIAYGAHIGGFISGLTIAAVLTSAYPTAEAWPKRR